MNVLHEIENMGIKVTWKLIAMGLQGFKGRSALIAHEELFDYLVDCLGRNDSQTDRIISLTCEKDDKKIESLVNHYASNDQSLESVQLRKWKAYFLKSLLDTDCHNFMQGLLALMEFWSSDECECPKDCPHEFPDNIKVSVQAYFTESNYRSLLNKNFNWLENEVQYIMQLEHDLDCL